MTVTHDDVCAIIITRGDVDLKAILDTLPYGEVLVRSPERTVRLRGNPADPSPFPTKWKHPDAKVYGRYLAAEYTTKPVVYFQDDDVIFREHDRLLESFNQRDFDTQWVGNVQPGLDDAQGYYDLALVGCGSLHLNGNWKTAFQKYNPTIPTAEARFNIDCDFVHGVLSHWKKVDLGLEVLDAAFAPNRLWQQPEQLEGKWASVQEARKHRTVVLTMLTKNEEKNVVRALSSARRWYDAILIHDSGSTDDTKLEVERWCAANGVPFAIRDTTFEGFAPARNALLHEGKQMGDYVLLMDADEEFMGDDTDPWPPLEMDVHILHYAGDFDIGQPRLIRSNFPTARFEGRKHAAMVWDTVARGIDLQSPAIHHHGDFTHGDGDIYDRIRKDVELLTQDIDEGLDVPHSTFMRAKAYEGLGEWALARADYEARLDFPDGDLDGVPGEQHFYARFRLGVILIEKFNNFAEGADHLMTAWFNRPKRNESIRALAHYLTVIADRTPYPENELVFVRRDSYVKQNTEGG